MTSIVNPLNQKPDDVPDQCLPNEEVDKLNEILSIELDKITNTKYDVAETISDPTSPLYSNESFKELKLKPILVQTCNEVGYLFPSKIQSACIPLIIRTPPVDVVAQAQNGTGKTATFLLSLFNKIDVDLKATQAIVLAPTIELAQQIEKVAIKLSCNLSGLKTFCCIRGKAFLAQNEINSAQLVIGTPGAIENHVCKYRSLDIKNVFSIVVDEADHVFRLPGFCDLVCRIFMFSKSIRPNIQLLFFSATFNDPVTEKVIADFAPNACRIETRKKENVLNRIKQYLVMCKDREDKFKAIIRVFSAISVTSTIIFVYSRKSVDWLEMKIRESGRQVATLHGGLSPEQRAENVRRFSESKVKVLIASDVAARGLDIPQVCLVVNYDPPIDYQKATVLASQGKGYADCETYLHRVGRTGRFGKPGLCINLADNEISRILFEEIANYYELKMQELDVTNYDELDKLAN